MAKRKRRRHVAGGHRRRRRHTAARSNPPRHRRRRVARRNPAGFSARGIMGDVVTGLKDTGGIISGELVSGLVEQNTPGLTQGTVQARAVGTVAAFAAAKLVGRRFMGARFSELMIAGAIARWVRAWIKSTTLLASVPKIPNALGEYGAGLPLVAGYDVAAGGASLADYRVRGMGAIPGSPPRQLPSATVPYDPTMAELYGYAIDGVGY